MSDTPLTLLPASLPVPGAQPTEGRRRVNGVELHVVEAGPADGPLVVLLHGFPEFWWGWRHQIGPLAAAGYRVVAPDMRGYGTSEKPRGLDAYGLDVLADDVAALAASYGQPRFRLVGHDWGAIVAWWAGVRHPDRIERLACLAGPHPDAWARRIRRSPGQAVRSWYVAFFGLRRLPEKLLSADGFAAMRRAMAGSARPNLFAPAELDRYAEAWAQPGALTAMIAYYRALRQRRPNLRQPARVRPPTLVLWGERDAFLQRALARDSAAQCDNAELLVLPGTTHWLHLEEPRAVNAILQRFLA